MFKLDKSDGNFNYNNDRLSKYREDSKDDEIMKSNLIDLAN